MKVIKRSGKEVKFDVSKIKAAIEKANINTIENQRLSDEQVDHCVKEVETKLLARERSSTVEEIQDLVENEIMKVGAFTVAKICYNE